MKRSIIVLIAGIVMAFGVGGCHDIQNTSGHVFDNANGALKTGDSKLWNSQGERDGQTTGTVDPVDPDDKNKRY